MTSFGNYLFKTTRRILTPSHNFAMKMIVFIPLILAVTAAFLSALSAWTWIYVSTPLTALNPVIVFLVLPIVYFTPDYGIISYSACQGLMTCWVPIALLGWYFCACFFETGSRLIASSAQNQDAG